MAKINAPVEASAEATTEPQTTAPQTTKRVVAAYTGHEGTTRIIRKEDQDFLTGVPGIAKQDLVWEAGSSKKVDITDTDEAVQDYLRKSDEFTVRTVEVPVEASVPSE